MPAMIPEACAALDIGKTNCKLTLMDGRGRALAERRRPNQVLRPPGRYAQHDSEGLWSWLLGVLREFAGLATVRAIVPVTHGATAALLDASGELVLPILDYEEALNEPEQLSERRYERLRAPFAQSGSPSLPAGLNLGRQIDWLARRFPAEFARTRCILMYPQYWAWRLSGVAASEVTSLGCHTDLWCPASADFGALVERQGWRALFPPLRPAWARLGQVLPAIAAATGLPADCQIVCGIHDSNASLLQHLRGEEGPRTVLSTGTWVIAAALGGAASQPLQEAQDMLVNIDALGRAVPCMRFMGGREFAAIAGAQPAAFGADDVQRLIAQRSLALPCFADAGGPFAQPHAAGRYEGPLATTPAEQAALATLYVVLMTDHCLHALGAEAHPVVVEGAFTANPFFGPLLAGLREGRSVRVSGDSSGTSVGAWLLQGWEGAAVASPEQPRSIHVQPLCPEGWQDYRAAWRSRLPGLAA